MYYDMSTQLSLYISFLQIIYLEYLIISLGINHASPKEEDRETRYLPAVTGNNMIG